LNAEQYDDKGKKHSSRRSTYRGELPDAGPLEYLYDYIVEAGLLTTWQEIKAWSELTGTHLEAWEAITMHAISIAYTNQFQQSTDMNCPCPFAPAEPTADISERLKATMLGLNK
jgi:hypothetical protein